MLTPPRLFSRVVAVAALALLVGCGPAPVKLAAVARPPTTVITTTTSTSTSAPPTTTTEPPHPTSPHVPASRTRNPVSGFWVPDAAFWRRLANCESRDGASGKYVGYFQLTWANAARVGIGPSSSYDEQEAGAQRWLVIIGGRGGTTAGWPRCWWTALRG